MQYDTKKNAYQDMALLKAAEKVMEKTRGHIPVALVAPSTQACHARHYVFVTKTSINIDDRKANQLCGDDGKGRQAAAPPTNQHHGRLWRR
jgi:hypothetical protein